MVQLITILITLISSGFPCDYSKLSDGQMETLSLTKFLELNVIILDLASYMSIYNISHRILSPLFFNIKQKMMILKYLYSKKTTELSRLFFWES